MGRGPSRALDRQPGHTSRTQRKPALDAALSGVFAHTYVTRIAQRESVFLEDNLTTDH